MATPTHAPLLIPALRASMGDWVYYIGFMSMGNIVARVSVAQDIHETQSLKDWLQRRLTDNSKRIATYLLTQKQRFFNAIVVGSYSGGPQWHEVAIKSGRADIPSNLEGAHGFLELRGDEVLFAVDGQHRVKGMEAAIAKNEGLRTEEVCTIFVKGVVASAKRGDPNGFERTRRLFATLNRYAKPVQKRDIIALDEDDIVAIITRRLVEEHPLFANKTAMVATKPIPASDSRNVTSIVALYDFLDVCLRDRGAAAWSEYKRFRPTDAEVKAWYAAAVRLWDGMCRRFPPLRAARDGRADDDLVREFRNRESGGHLLFRPVGLLGVARALRHWGNAGVSNARAVGRIARVPMHLAAAPWEDLVWDSVNHRMIPEGKQGLIAKVLFHASGGDLSLINSSAEKLRRELAGVRGESPSETRLRVYRGR